MPKDPLAWLKERIPDDLIRLIKEENKELQWKIVDNRKLIQLLRSNKSFEHKMKKYENRMNERIEAQQGFTNV